MQLPPRNSDHREIEWEQLSLGNYSSLIDLAGQVQPTFHRSPMPNLEIVRPDEQGLISNPTGACSGPSNGPAKLRALSEEEASRQLQPVVSWHLFNTYISWP